MQCLRNLLTPALPSTGVLPPGGVKDRLTASAQGEVEARSLLHHVLEHGNVVGRDRGGRTVIQLALDDWVYEKLMAFDAEATELEDGGDVEPDDDAQEDWLPVVLLDVVRPKVIRRRRPLALVPGAAD